MHYEILFVDMSMEKNSVETNKILYVIFIEVLFLTSSFKT